MCNIINKTFYKPSLYKSHIQYFISTTFDRLSQHLVNGTSPVSLCFNQTEADSFQACVSFPDKYTASSANSESVAH